MAIDLMAIQPSVIPRNLSGKYILLSGEPKNLGQSSVMNFDKAVKIWNPEMGIRAEVGV